MSESAATVCSVPDSVVKESRGREEGAEKRGADHAIERSSSKHGVPKKNMSSLQNPFCETCFIR